MGMNISTSGSDDEQAISAINTTPLVDVMLVLLIIFLITIPVVNYSVPVDVPKERSEVRESNQETIVLSVDAAGNVYWFDSPVRDMPTLIDKLVKVAKTEPQPEVHIRGDWRSDYAPVGKIIYAAQSAGIAKVGFITEPPARN